jgi:two-component SAPR family response regulator
MDKVWYYMKPDRSKYGPYSDDELISLIQNDILNGNDYIWMPDMKKWLKVGNSIYSVFLRQPSQERI